MPIQRSLITRRARVAILIIRAAAIAGCLFTEVAHRSAFAQLLGTIENQNLPNFATTIYSGISRNILRVQSIGDFDKNGVDDLAFLDPTGIDSNPFDGHTAFKDIFIVYSPAAATGLSAQVNLKNVTGAGGNDCVDGITISSIGPDEGGMIIAPIGDVDGDMKPDLAIANFSAGIKQFQSGSAEREGRVQVLFGNGSERTTGLIDLEQIGGSVPGMTIRGTSQDDFVGNALVGVGDVNGDSYDDFLIGAHATEHPYYTGGGENDAGMVYLVYGNCRSDLLGQHTVDDVGGSLSGVKIVSEGWQGEAFGESISVGDVNNDGRPDILIGGSDQWGWGHGPTVKRAFVIFGPQASAEFPPFLRAEAIGKSTTTTEVLSHPIFGPDPIVVNVEENIDETIPGAVISNPTTTSGWGFGGHIVALGDVNGDDIDDFVFDNYLVFGQTGESLKAEQEVVDFETITGIVRQDPQILVDRIGTLDPNINAVPGAQINTGLLEIKKAGDFNGDGLDDFLIGNHLVYSKPSNELMTLAASSPDGVLSITNLSSVTFGDSLSVFPAGDLNDDGLSDVIVVNPNAGAEGELYLILGQRNIPGDLNSDNLVNSQDLNIVLSNFNSVLIKPGVWALGDPSGDGVVNSSDLNIVLSNWGNGSGGVPEPTSVTMAWVAAAIARQFRFHRRPT